MILLPRWIIPHSYPSVHDSESLTVIEMTSKLYGAVKELAEEHNKFMTDIENAVAEFETNSTEDMCCFKTKMTCIIENYIKTMDLQFKQMTKDVDEKFDSANKIIDDGLKEIDDAKNVMLNEIEVTAEITQSIGDSETMVMSQKATTDFGSELANHCDIASEMCGNILPMSPSAWIQGAIQSDGTFVNESRRIVTDFIDTKNITNLHFKTNSEKTVRISVIYFNLIDGVYTRVTESGWKTDDTDFDVTIFDAVRIAGANIENTPITPFDVLYLYSGASLTADKVIDKDDIRIMQYNIGRYNYGVSGGLATDKIPEKLANYKKFFGEYRPDIVCLQEYEQYIDGAETISADNVLFGELFPYLPASHYPAIFRSSIPWARYDSGMLGNDDTSTRTRYTLATFNIKNKKVAVLTTALYYNNATARGIQFNEAMQILSKYDYAIFAGDLNFADQTEMDNLLQIGTDNGFKACNGGFFGSLPTIHSMNYFRPIDNILVKGDMVVRNVFVPDVYDKLSSDHYPIIADIRIN